MSKSPAVRVERFAFHDESPKAQIAHGRNAEVKAGDYELTISFQFDERTLPLTGDVLVYLTTGSFETLACEMMRTNKIAAQRAFAKALALRDEGYDILGNMIE